MNAATVHLWNEPPIGHAIWSDPRVFTVVRVSVGSAGDTAEDYAAAAANLVQRRHDIRQSLGLDFRGYALAVDGFGNETNTDSPNVFRDEDDEVEAADLSPKQGPFTANGRASGRAWGEAFATEFEAILRERGLPMPSFVLVDAAYGLRGQVADAVDLAGWIDAAVNDPRAGTEVVDGRHTLNEWRRRWWFEAAGSVASDGSGTPVLEGDDGETTDSVFALIASIDSFVFYDTLIRPIVRACRSVRAWGLRGVVWPSSANPVVGRARPWELAYGGSQAVTAGGTLQILDGAPLPGSSFVNNASSGKSDWATTLGVALTGTDATDAETLFYELARRNVAALRADGKRLASGIWLDRPGATYNLGGVNGWSGSSSAYTYTTTATLLKRIASRAGLQGVSTLVLTPSASETVAAWDTIQDIAAAYLRGTDVADTPLVWPPALNELWNLAGHNETPGSSLVESPVDVGPAKRRRRGTSAPDVVNMSMFATRDELDALLVFFKETTEDGSLRFQRADTITDEDRVFRFLGPPSYTPIATIADADRALDKVWRVQLSLERLAKPGVPDAESATLYVLDGDTGTNTFASDSSITASFTEGCFLDTNDDGDPETVSLLPPLGRVYRFARAINPSTVGETTFADRIEWEYTDSGYTSTISFDKDDGWAYTNNTNHVRQPGCDAGSGDVTLRPLDGDEITPGEPLFRHKGLAAITNENADDLCETPGESSVVWAKTFEATLVPGSGPSVAARASGFRDYEAVCAVPVEFCTLDGDFITATIAHDSSLTIRTRTGCYAGSALSLTPLDTKTYVFAECVHDGLDVPLYVEWQYADGDGTSWVRLHRDDGWSYSVDADHRPAITCSGSTIAPTTGGTSSPGFPFFRDASQPPMSNGIADAICDDEAPPLLIVTDDDRTRGVTWSDPDGTVSPPDPDGPGAQAWFAKVDCVFQFGSTVSIPSRGAGFQDIWIYCNTGGPHP